MTAPGFPSLSILAALASSGSRAVTIADSLWFRGGRMQGLFAYDEALRRIVFNDKDWSVQGGAGGITLTASRANVGDDRRGSYISTVFASREDEMAEEELRRKAYEHFVLRRDDGCGIVAILVYEKAHTASSPDTDESTPARPRLVVDFLGSERLGLFLKQPLSDQDVLVCRYMGPGMGNWSVVQCVWTDNRLIAVERRVNKHAIQDRSLPVAVRVSTTAADPQHNQPVPVPPGTQARLAKICAAVAAAIHSGAFDPPSGSERYGLYFFSTVPFGASGKSGRWVFLGANEAPLPQLATASPTLQQVIPARQLPRRGPTLMEDESVAWTVENSPMKHTMSFMTDYFKPRRGMASRPQTVDAPVLPSIIEGTRRVKPKRVMTPQVRSSSAASFGASLSPLRRAATPAQATHPLLNRGDVSGVLAERDRQLAMVEANSTLTATEWRAAVTDVSLLGYLANPPFARAASPPSRFSPKSSAPAPMQPTKLTRDSPPSQEHTANRDAVSVARPFSRHACLSSKALRRAAVDSRGPTGGLPPTQVTYVGRSVFKTSFVSRLIQAMDSHEGRQAESIASVPSTPSKLRAARVSPIDPDMVAEDSGVTPLGSPVRQQPAPSPTSTATSPTGQLAAARRTTLTAAERAGMKRRELLSRYNPMAMLGVVEDALYCVYSQTLDDPSAIKDALLLAKPMTTVISQSNNNAKASESVNKQTAPSQNATILNQTVDVPLLPIHDGMHRELVHLLGEVGVSVVEVPQEPSSVDGPSVTLIARFPNKNDAASKVRVKLAGLCRELDNFISNMTASDVVAIQREVAENGDKIFHDVMMLAVRASKSKHALSAIALMNVTHAGS